MYNAGMAEYHDGKRTVVMWIGAIIAANASVQYYVSYAICRQENNNKQTNYYINNLMCLWLCLCNSVNISCSRFEYHDTNEPNNNQSTFMSFTGHKECVIWLCDRFFFFNEFVKNSCANYGDELLIILQFEMW